MSKDKRRFCSPTAVSGRRQLTERVKHICKFTLRCYPTVKPDDFYFFFFFYNWISLHETFFSLFIDGEQSFTLAPGRYQLNFSLELPIAIAPSFEGKYGSTRYKIQVKITRSWKITRKFTRPFHVLPVSNFNPTAIDTVMTLDRNE